MNKAMTYLAALGYVPTEGRNALRKAVTADHELQPRRIQIKRLNGEWEPATGDHHDPRVARLDGFLQTARQSGLGRTFCRGRIRLYIDRTPLPEADSVPGILRRLHREFHLTPFMQDTRAIVMPEIFLDILTPDQLESIVAHELGHHMQLDGHFKRRLHDPEAYCRQSEKLADKIAVFLTGGAVTDAGLDKISLHQGNAVMRLAHELKADSSRRFTGKKAMSAAADWVIRDNLSAEKLTSGDAADKSHPSNRERYADNERYCKMMQTPEGATRLEDEIRGELAAIHRALFPKQFSRSVPNIRA